MESSVRVCAPERAPSPPPLTVVPVKQYHYGINQFYMRNMALRVSGVCLLVVAALAAAGCGAAAGPSAETPAQRCAPPIPARARALDLHAPPQTVGRADRLTARVSTSCGEFSIALEPRRFPVAVNSFVFLARTGFYDGTRFDKAGAGRYLHGGDPPGPAEGPGYRVSEDVPVGFIYRHRLVALSDLGGGEKGSAGSQFFIVVAKPWLDAGGDSLPIGVVKDGFGVVDRISRLGPGDPDESANLGVTGEVGPLRRPVAIESISIEKG